MNSGGVTVSDSPTPANLFEEFEEAFQNCVAPLTKEDPLNGINVEELRTISEANAQRFLDLARQMEATFLQQRYLLSVQKPELILTEDTPEMRTEIARKDELIKKHSEKLSAWQAQLMAIQAKPAPFPSPVSRPAAPTAGTTGVHMGMMTSASATSQSNQVPMQGLSPVGGTVSHSGPGMQHTMTMTPNVGMSVGQPSVMGQKLDSQLSNPPTVSRVKFGPAAKHVTGQP